MDSGVDAFLPQVAIFFEFLANVASVWHSPFMKRLTHHMAMTIFLEGD
jgi:hypothetical protein